MKRESRSKNERMMERKEVREREKERHVQW